MEYLIDMILVSPINRVPEFLKCYNCLEFIKNVDYESVLEYSNVQLNWDLDSNYKNKRINLKISLYYKYNNQLMIINLDRSKLIMSTYIKFDAFSENDMYDIGFSFEFSKIINIPGLKKSLTIEFDKNTKYKDITDSLIQFRCEELYNKLLDDGILFDQLKPHMKDIKNFELLFLNKVDFINDNYSNIVDMSVNPN